jgi:hypothetical protein
VLAGVLYIGNDAALNTQTADGLFSRTGGLQGLPTGPLANQIELRCVLGVRAW